MPRAGVGLFVAAAAAALPILVAACSGDEGAEAQPSPTDPSGTGTDASPAQADPGPAPAPTAPGTNADSGADAAPDAAPLRPLAVDRTNPKQHDFTFKANVADPAATQSLGLQGAHLDTRVASVGKLVVFLHGAGTAAPASCDSPELATVLAPKGFHVLLPCYNSYYGVGACGADIGGCRLEAFDGVDRTPVISISRADAIEPRIVKALTHLTTLHPGGDWSYFLDGDKPRYGHIVIAGISHGASTAGLIGLVREVDRVVMLSGPLDSGQAWLSGASLTPRDRFYGFSHTADTQHAGHLAAFAALQVPGAATSIDGKAAPYGGSHRLITSAATTNGHSSTAPGGASPRTGAAYTFAPAWQVLFGR